MVALPLINFGIMVAGAMTFISNTSSGTTVRGPQNTLK